MQPTPTWIRRSVRTIGGATIAFALLAAVVGLLPGYRDYRDANGCGEHALEALFSFEHQHRGPCTHDWVYQQTRPAGGPGLAAIMVGLALTAVVLVWRPRLRWLLVWWLTIAITTVVTVVATFSLDFDFDVGTRTDELWPVAALTYLTGAAAVLVFVVAPLGCLVGALVPWIQRRRAARA